MCGRIALYTPPQRLARLLEAALAAGVDTDAVPSWNLAPTRTLFGVADRGEGRVLDAYRWGLVPSWAKDPSSVTATFNARAESVSTKPAFRAAFERRRLLVPVDGFYEWDRRGPAKVPHYFTRADEGPIVLAGLSEFWRDRAGGPWLASCTVITTSDGPDMDGIHDRMPVVLDREAHELWLTAREDELDAVRALCRPASAGTLVHHPVGPRVGNVREDDASLILEAPPSEAQQAQLF